MVSIRVNKVNSELKPENSKGRETFTRKIGGRTYKITVGYNQAFLDAASSDPEKLIQSVFDQAEKKIAKLAESKKKQSFRTKVKPPVEPKPQLPRYNLRHQNVQDVQNVLKHIDEHSVAKDKYGIKEWRFGKYLVHEYDEDSDNNQKIEGFLVRQKSLYGAVIHYVIKKYPDLLDAIEQANQTFLETMKGYSEAPFRVIYKEATLAIAQFAKEVQLEIQKENPKFTINDLARSESKFILEQDRPIVVNIFDFNGKKFFSMQTPESTIGKTIPSSLRDRGGLANYVKTTFGEIKENGQIQVTYQAVRHGCYPPYMMEDFLKRQAHAIANVKQGLTDWAKRILHSEQPHAGTKEDPIVIPLRTMMLFTAKLKLLDQMRNRRYGLFGKWRGESERMQLKESALALKVFHNRTIPLEVDGKTLWAKVDTSAMNFGANPGALRRGILGKIPNALVQKKINAKGFLQFLRDTGTEALETSHPFLEKMLEANEQSLVKSYEKLEKLYGEPVGRQIRKVKRKIRRKERKSDYAALALVSLKRRFYKKNWKEIKIEETKMLDQSDNKEAFKAVFMAREIFYRKCYLETKSALDFQSLYIFSMDQLGYLVEFFCKSAEDRTGSVDDRVQALKAYLSYFEKFPEDHSEINMLRHDFTKIVHYFSASQDNTVFNSNARGLQVHHTINPDFDAKSDKYGAKLAKKIFSLAKKM